MRLQDDIDFTTLTWVKAELDETLKQARHALEAYVEDPTDASQMRFCATYLHQVQGTLRMVELYGAAMVTEEMEHLASALLENDVKDRDEAYGVLMRGIVQLPDYLERLQTGHKDIPIVLLPLLNDLRGARGEKSLSEIVLFTPDLTRPLPISAKGPLASLPEQELRQFAEQLRGQFQLALLNWFRNADVDANISRIAQVCDKLVAIVAQEEARRLFWVAAGVMEALRAKAFEPSPQLRQTIGKVEREIKRLADAGENSFRVDPPRELTRNLLYFVAHAPTEHGRIGELRQVFRLQSLLPTEAEIAHARGSMSGHNRALIDTVSVAIKEDLMRVKDALDFHLRTENASPEGLASQVEVLDRVSDTLGMLGLGVARRVVQEQRTAVHQVATGARASDEATLLDIAGALLYVEASLDDQVQHLGGGAAEVESGGRALPQAEARKVLEALVKEAQANFAQAKQCFVAFVESNWDHAQLQDVPRLLEEVSGAMRILELTDPPQYLLAIRRFTEAELLARKRVPNGQQMDTLADALASLEYYLEAVREHRAGRDKILEVTRNSLETLGYWPLPDAELVPVPAPVATVAAPPVAMVEPVFVEPAPVSEVPEVPVLPVAAVAAVEITPPQPEPVPAGAAAVGILLSGFEGASDEIDEEIREVFVEEVQEEITNLGELLPSWKNDPHQVDLLKPIRRVFHTLKGSGRLVGALTLGEFSWKIENMLNRVLDKSIQPTPAVQAIIGHAYEVLPQLLAALRGEGGVRADIEGIKAVAERLTAGEQAWYEPVAQDVPAPVVDVEPVESEATVELPIAVIEEAPIVEPEMAVEEPEEADSGQMLASIDPVLFDILKTEVAGHLDTMHEYLDAANASPRPATDALLRAVHTMNGAFAMTDVPVITEVVGPLEGYIKRLLAQTATPSASGLAAIGDAAEAVRVLMLELEAPRPRLPDLGELTARIIAERDALPEPVGPSMPLHLEVDEEEATLTEAVTIAPPMATPQMPVDVPAESEIAAASAPFVDSTETRAEESFPSFASELSGFDNEPVFDPAPAAPVETPIEIVAIEAPATREAAPVGADEAVSVFDWPEADATLETAAEPLALDTGTAAEPGATPDELVLDESAFDDFAFENSVLEEPAIKEPELAEPAADLLVEFDAAFGAAETASRDAMVDAATPEPVFDESHIDSVRAAEPAADITAESPIPVLSVPVPETEALEPAEELSFEAELLALGDLDVGTDTLEFEILEASDEEGHDLAGLELAGHELERQARSNDATVEPLAFADADVPVEASAPTLDDNEIAGAALAAETPVASDDAAALEAMIAAYEAAPPAVVETGVDDSDTSSEAANVKAADVEAADARVDEADIEAAAFAGPSVPDDELTTAAAAATREATELAELDAQIAALEAADAAAVAANEAAAREAAIAQLEAEQADMQSRAAAEAAAAQHAAELAEREAARAAADAEAEAAALAAAEVAAAQARADAAAKEAADVAEAAAAKEATELAELEAEIAALDAAEAETARLAAEGTQSESEAASFAATESSLLPDAPLADYAAEAAEASAEEVAAEEAGAQEAAASGAAPVTAAAALTAGLAEADADPEGPLELPDLDEELLDIFLEEGGDLLDHSDGLMARLRETPADREIVVGLQRDLHTLKGGARMAGIAPIGDLGHAMESLLESVAEGKRELTGVGLETLERAFDRLHSMVTRVGKRQALAMPMTLIDRVEALGRGETLQPLGAAAPAAAAIESAVAVPQRPEPTPTAMDIAAAAAPAPAAHSAPLSEPMADEDDISVRAPQEQIRIRADLLDRLVNYAGEVAIYRARLEQQLGLFRGNLGELDQTTTRLREQLRKLEIETEAQIVARYQREAEVGDSAFDPLELDRFSTLQQLSRALSESAADIVNLQTTLEDHTRQYETLLLQQSRVSSELQEGLMRTRMVPFDSLVPRLRRIIRQTAGELGKKAQLKVEGAQGEMDRNVLDRMTAPLEHMLRNALAHGLETPEVRVAAGKPEEGTVKIAVQREGSEVVITVSDDGRGLDRDAIRNKAMERGLMKADAQLSDRDLYGFILETGFSTATSVSKIAGRGVGMDVVHSEIRQLGGSLYINSERGKGSEFVVRLPFTLAVTQAVFVKHGDTMFSVPISSVQGVARIDRATLEEQIASGEPTFTYAGESYSIYDLGLLLGQSHVRAEDSLQVPLLLARSGDQRAAICVDQVIGSREIVVKPVGPQVSSIPGIFGATVMGDGRVIVILDFAPLVRRSAAMRKSGDAPVIPVPVEQRRIPLVMVVDDSITMRKVTGRVLERHNYEVITAKDGVDAIEKLQERIPDVMLLDIEMPRMDGYELATHMRNDGRLRGIPIIMITSRTGEKHRQRAFEIGVDRYLGKPYQENELMRNVHEILKVGRGGVG